MKKVLLVLGLFCLVVQAFGQVVLKRQVISSIGGSAKLDSTVYISHTLGQPPHAGTAQMNNYLRQGFEQPKSINLCDILVNFVVEEINTECGSYYSFEYTGTSKNGLEFNWNFGSQGLPGDSRQQNVMDVAFMAPGQYIIELTVTDENGCQSAGSKLIDVVGTAFSATGMFSSQDCESNEYSYSIQAFNGTGPYEISWSDGSSEFERSDLPVGMYSYTVSDANGCEFEDNINIIIDFQNPQIALTGRTVNTICDTTELGSIDISVTGGLQPYTFQWSNNASSEDLSDLFPGEYVVTITDERGCSSERAYIIGVDCLSDGEIPNAYSPNGDDINDYWIVPEISRYPNNSLEIFNRWGSSIYKAEPYNNGWNGVNQDGEELPLGAYYYVLQLNDQNETQFSGSITIIR